MSKSTRITLATSLLATALGSALVMYTLSTTQSIAPDSVSPTTFAETLRTEPERQLIDVRTPAEYATGHIPGARNLDFYASDFADTLATLDRTQPLAIYCRSGSRTGQTLELLRTMGFQDVIELQGGIIAWDQTLATPECTVGQC